MTDDHINVSRLRRPKLLVRAARMAALGYRRERDLKALVHGETCNPLAALLETEEALEQTRVAGDAAYSIHTHVKVLTALIAEARKELPSGEVPG